MIPQALLLLLPIFILFLKYSFFRKGPLPPGPNAWMLLRNISNFRKRPHTTFANLAKTYGPIMSLRLGSQLVVIATSPSIAREFLKTNDRNFSGRYLPSVCYKVPQAINSSLTMATECNESWNFLRGMAQNFIFCSKAIDSKSELRKAKVIEMVEYLRTKEGEVVDVEDLIDATVTNIVSNTLVSRNLFDPYGQSENDERVKALIHEIIEMAGGLGLADIFPFLRGFDFWNNRKGMELYRRILSISERMVKERRERQDDGANSSRDFVDVLIENGLSDDQICLVFFEILTAGSDSSTITSVWLMVELISHPDVLQKARDEIAKAFQGDEPFNESILNDCLYLQACMKETLRFHLPGPFLVPHRALETCMINNYLIPKDTMVLINAWAIARDPESWEDATSFKPERFLGSKIGHKGTHFEFIPFSAGRRMCPGSNVAFRNIPLLVASLVHYFDWSLPDGADPTTIDMSDKFGTTLRKEKPLCLIPRPRESDMPLHDD